VPSRPRQARRTAKVPVGDGSGWQCHCDDGDISPPSGYRVSTSSQQQVIPRPCHIYFHHKGSLSSSNCAQILELKAQLSSRRESTGEVMGGCSSKKKHPAPDAAAGDYPRQQQTREPSFAATSNTTVTMAPSAPPMATVYPVAIEKSPVIVQGTPIAQARPQRRSTDGMTDEERFYASRGGMTGWEYRTQNRMRGMFRSKPSSYAPPPPR
jgi:hypothetical protein